MIAATKPNVDAARAFLSRLDPDADSFTFQTFDDTNAKRNALARVMHGALDRVAAQIASMQQRGAGAFVTVNATDGKGRQASNVVKVRAVFVDLDGAPLKPVLDCGLEPHMIVESSPGRWHAYWLTDDCQLEIFERVQRALAKRFDGDPSVHDLPRVMRVPGFLHQKGEPFQARMVEEIGVNGRPYALAEIIGTLGLNLGAGPSEKRHYAASADRIAPGERHSHLFAAGRSMAKRGMTQPAVRAALKAENDARCEPPVPTADVEYLADRAFSAKDAATWDPPRAPTAQADAAHDNSAQFDERPTDAGNARWFARRFGSQVRWVPERGGWLVNRGTHWRLDQDGEVERLAKAAITGIFEGIGDLSREARNDIYKHGLRSEQAPRIAAALSLLKSEAGITIPHTLLDADPFLVGVENGAIDLRTGQLRQPSADEYITRQVGAAFDPAAQCPTWIAFLERITDGSAALVEFLQRAIGYSLTGDNREQVVFIPFGPGANGKSVLISTTRALANDYGADASADTFLDRRDGAASNDLARLAGARFVPASEVDEGKRLAESLIKSVTGGEAMSARFLFREFFSFTPQFKLWLSVNHKPQIRGDDHGIWRRIRLIPFLVTIPPDEQDRELATKLRLELPGILNWAIAGCQAWLKHGLQPPAEVLEATAEYRAESDAIGEWIDENCLVGVVSSIQAKLLYDNYRAFTSERGAMPLSMRRWAQRMAERGYKKDEGRIVHYRGIALRDLCDLRDQIPQPSLSTASRGEVYEKGRKGREGRNYDPDEYLKASNGE